MGVASTPSFALALTAAIIAVVLGHLDVESVGHRPEGTVRGPDKNHPGDAWENQKSKPHVMPNSGIGDDGAVAPPLGITADEAAHAPTAPVAPGGKGGLEAGDKITSIAGTDVANSRDMLAAMREAAAESTEVAVIINRGGKKVEITLRP